MTKKQQKNKVMGKTYEKMHELRRVKDVHKKKIKKRGGRIIEDCGLYMEYDFPANKPKIKEKGKR